MTLQIQALEAAAASDAALVTALTDLINEVYAVAEQGLWTEGATRTTREEMTALVGAEQIVAARLERRLVGCIRVQRLDGETSEFGMLAADQAHRGLGVGRDLVRYAERWGRGQGCARMQLELLTPRAWSHPSKEVLAGWYGRIGYKVVRTRTIEETYPALAPLLATPCDFVICRKDLT
ncbi:MAG: GNAT family N-acetyltransferase [Actinoallomurus sp.]